ncbi:MAG: hypothetical protein Q8L90_16405 [Bacteroidota bacterium]|nr:hypothetical protein [Bacteroidota bacterium]
MQKNNFVSITLFVLISISCTNKNTVSNQQSRPKDSLQFFENITDTITRIDTSEKQIKFKQSENLLKFEYTILEWTEEDLKAKKGRKQVPFHLGSKELNGGKLALELWGVKGWGSYKGNIEMKENNKIIIYYWLDENQPYAHHMNQIKLLYIIKLINPEKKYNLKIVSL